MGATSNARTAVQTERVEQCTGQFVRRSLLVLLCYISRVAAGSAIHPTVTDSEDRRMFTSETQNRTSTTMVRTLGLGTIATAMGLPQPAVGQSCSENYYIHWITSGCHGTVCRVGGSWVSGQHSWFIYACCPEEAECLPGQQGEDEGCCLKA
jgi:hypothetical protein